jgi:hypothetical protein
MHIRAKSWHFKGSGGVWGVPGTAIFLTILGGCAAPGNPLPPTLNLPQIVSGSTLTATRVGAEVRLHWTTPTQTTDKLAVKGSITAEICREIVSGAVREKAPCSGVGRVQVAQGASDAADALPAELLAGPPRLLAYRVQLINSAGRTAGPSAAVLAVSGPSTAPVDGFTGEATKSGVELRWERQGTGNREQGTVELVRTLLDAAPAKRETQSAGGSVIAALSGSGKQSAETRMNAAGGGAYAGGADTGGTVDRTVEIGHEYRYTAQRVVRVEVGGQTLEARSKESAALQFAVRDVFAPDVPKGLVAVPGTVGGVGSDAATPTPTPTPTPTIELSWDPDIEPRLAGYRVYRRDEGSAEWQRVGPDPVTEAAYRDLKVTAGRRYSYRVTAVSTAGKESGPSSEAAETASGVQ